MPGITYGVNLTIQCPWPGKCLVTISDCCYNRKVSGLSVTISGVGSYTTDSNGQFSFPLVNGCAAYTATWSDTTCCKGGSTTLRPCTGQYDTACTDKTAGIRLSIKDTVSCCDPIGTIPKVLKLTDSLGGCLLTNNGMGWQGCSIGTRQNVDDTKHNRQMMGRVTLGGDQTCVSPLCYKMGTSWGGWFKSWRDINTGQTGVRYTLSCGYDVYFRPVLTLSANWLDDWHERYDQCLMGTAYWCAECTVVYPPPEHKIITQMPGTPDCLPYPVNKSVTFIRDPVTNYCKIAEAEDWPCGVGNTQGYKSVTSCNDISSFGAKASAVNVIDKWSKTCDSFNETFTLLPGKNSQGQQLVFGLESPTACGSNWIQYYYYPLMSPPPGGETVTIGLP